MTVAQALHAFFELATTAAGKGPGAAVAQTELANIQHELYVGGFYGTKPPSYGSLSPKNADLNCLPFRPGQRLTLGGEDR